MREGGSPAPTVTLIEDQLASTPVCRLVLADLVTGGVEVTGCLAMFRVVMEARGGTLLGLTLNTGDGPAIGLWDVMSPLSDCYFHAHRYTTAGGTFVAQATLTYYETPGHIQSVMSQPVVVTIAPQVLPVADFTLTVGADRHTVTVDPNLSTAASGIIEWRFRVDEGAWVTGARTLATTPFATPAEVYLANGAYSVTVEVTNAGYASAQATQALTIDDGTTLPPTCSLSDPVVALRQVTVTPTAADADGTVASLVLHWGDGALTAGCVSGTAYTHTYPATGGSFAVYAVATDNAGATASSATRTVDIDAEAPPNSPPTCALSVPLVTLRQVTVTPTAADADGTIASLVVHWGDGAVTAGCVSGTAYTHSYAASGGSFGVYARATDNVGATTNSATRTVSIAAEVRQNCPPTCVSTVQVGPDGRTVTIDARGSRDADGTIVGWRYRLGERWPWVTGAAGLLAVASYPEAYLVTVEVTDNAGASAQQSCWLTLPHGTMQGEDGMTTLAELRSAVADALGQPLDDAGRLSTARVDRAINEGLIRWALDTSCWRATRVLAAGAAGRYLLPGDAFAVQQVRVDGAPVPASEITLLDADWPTWRQASAGSPQVWLRDSASVVRLVPAPLGAPVVEAEVYLTPSGEPGGIPLLVQPTDVPALPAAFRSVGALQAIVRLATQLLQDDPIALASAQAAQVEYAALRGDFMSAQFSVGEFAG
jgi:hypothetical protein